MIYAMNLNELEEVKVLYAGVSSRSEKLSTEELKERLRIAHNVLPPKSIWVHVKTGNEYVVAAVVLRENDLMPMVVYHAYVPEEPSNTVTFVREMPEFLDGFRPKMKNVFATVSLLERTTLRG